MNAPVSPTATAVRTKFAPGPETGGSAGGSPFASALDDALSADRPRGGSAASDRGIERREGGHERAAERAVAKDARATQKASDKAARAAERPTAHAGRAPDTDDAAGDPAEAAGETTAGETTAATTTGDEAAADSPAAASSGLPGAIWALLMGTASPSAGETTAAPVTAVAAAVPGTTAPAEMPRGSLSLPGLPTAGEAVPAPPAPPAVPAATGTAVPSADAAVPPAATPPTGQGTTPAPAAAALADLSIEIAPALQQTATATAAPAAAAAVLPEAAVPATVAAAAPAPVDGTAAPSTAADAIPAAAPVPVAGAGTSGGGTATSGGGTRQDARSGETQAAPVGVTTSPAAGAPAVPVAATVDAVSSTTAPAPPVGSQIARQVAVLRGGPDGAQTMTLVLSPENLGPVEVSVTLSKGTVDLTLRGAHDMGRAALLDGLPDLRRDLESAGLTCSRLEVDRDTGGSWLARHSGQGQQGQPDRGGQQTAGENRSRPRGAHADSPVSGMTSTSHRSTSSGVDYRV